MHIYIILEGTHSSHSTSIGVGLLSTLYLLSFFATTAPFVWDDGNGWNGSWLYCTKIQETRVYRKINSNMVNVKYFKVRNEPHFNSVLFSLARPCLNLSLSQLSTCKTQSTSRQRTHNTT